MTILTRPSYVRSLKRFSKAEVDDINGALEVFAAKLGKPHEHSGLGVRKLRKKLFELRAGLQIRILFAMESGDVVLTFAGSHDEVRAWIKENT